MKYLLIILLISPSLAFAGFMAKDGSILKYHDEDGIRYIDDSKTSQEIISYFNWRAQELNYAQVEYDKAKNWDDVRQELLTPENVDWQEVTPSNEGVNW